ncbi:MAG: hypothetical protein LBN21_06185 [Treponema sp.]|nr:hypothetical protein [Treponema sp.]
MQSIKKRRSLLAAALFPLFFSACPTGVERVSLPALGENSFYAQNFTNNKFYEVKAEMLVEGDYCVVWAEQSAKVSLTIAKNIAYDYDHNIYPKMIEAFSSNEGYDVIVDEEIKHFGNILDFANWLAKGDAGDGRLTILLLDIKDGYTLSGNSYTAGYFWRDNFLGSHFSNEADMIYVDTYPNNLNLPESRATIAHELQHLINYATSVYIDRQQPVDTWIDEGLSSAAEYLYLENHPFGRYGWFINDLEGTIARGNNFFVWGNHKDIPNAILDDYGSVYLFFQWLRLQNGGDPGIYKQVITSPYPDERAVTAAAAKTLPANGPDYGKWETLLGTWLAANYIRNPSGPYGYLSDPTLSRPDVWANKVWSIQVPENTLDLAPGEAVYSAISGQSFTPPADSGDNILYAGITQAKNKNAGGITAEPPYSGDMLLTFNGNTLFNGPPEPGFLTGGPADFKLPRLSGRQALPELYAVDPRDLPGRPRE